jgi:cation transport ATPase
MGLSDDRQSERLGQHASAADSPALAHAAVSVLIIADRCALGLATPISIMMPNRRGAPSGILIRNALGVHIAAGILCPVLGWLLSPMIAAAAMSLSSASDIGNALRLGRADIDVAPR